jgi:Rab-3A-interacting protein
MMMVDQTSITNTIDSISDHRSDLSDANSVDSAFSIENGVSTASEISENSSSTATLLNELQRVKEDLKSKDIEIQRAYEIRENTDREIEELTSSLFESAHSMVEQAKYAQANAEQKLKIANQTIDALVLENTQLKKTVSELKEIINNFRPSLSTNRSNPSTSTLSSTEQPESSIRKIVREKLHKRSSSDLQKSLSSIDLLKQSDNNTDDCPMVDNVLLREFARWEEKPTNGKDLSAFMHRVYSEDILPCLTLPNADLSSKILKAIEQNDMTMETSNMRTIDDTMKICSLMGDLCQCNYRVRIGEDGEWYPISQLARNRIASVCDFFTFVRHVQSGLVKSDTQSRYNKIIELRKQMAFARLGL